LQCILKSFHGFRWQHRQEFGSRINTTTLFRRVKHTLACGDALIQIGLKVSLTTIFAHGVLFATIATGHVRRDGNVHWRTTTFAHYLFCLLFHLFFCFFRRVFLCFFFRLIHVVVRTYDRTSRVVVFMRLIGMNRAVLPISNGAFALNAFYGDAQTLSARVHVHVYRCVLETSKQTASFFYNPTCVHKKRLCLNKSLETFYEENKP